MDAPGTTDAAVLVPLYLDRGELHAVFTKRRDDLPQHAGEISFPGGRQGSPDEDLRFTALREAEEEIGLTTGDVELGRLLGSEQPGAEVVDDRSHARVAPRPAPRARRARRT